MTPLRRATGGGDQEKVTCLSPASATNISGAPAGTAMDDDNMKWLALKHNEHIYSYITHAHVDNRKHTL